ncbi:hypothetical protein SARC_04969 [Sphaeroforma arctica JP610]|uniref:Uncharacterized protein n=1 Tax=Sphaeroforma arctica JP610 TaxID=667725 RepID=A0A0L0G101_9EUKA|nr:hypothetical protein SARC_04969 [Sphaeroforma arctica JP610]KNC82755.1 hypothetical protein SARC_04969 [Sphaeroforma arctica JP610]|eukprot:XP_014156657.1 hypothetical protein SARC_04969 [Sphaeroforma arctica JP610]
MQPQKKKRKKGSGGVRAGAGRKSVASGITKTLPDETLPDRQITLFGGLARSTLSRTASQETAIAHASSDSQALDQEGEADEQTIVSPAASIVGDTTILVAAYAPDKTLDVYLPVETAAHPSYNNARDSTNTPDLDYNAAPNIVVDYIEKIYDKRKR